MNARNYATGLERERERDARLARIEAALQRIEESQRHVEEMDELVLAAANLKSPDYPPFEADEVTA